MLTQWDVRRVEVSSRKVHSHEQTRPRYGQSWARAVFCLGSTAPCCRSCSLWHFLTDGASTSLGVLSDTPMNREGCLDDAFQSKAYQMSYPREKLANYQAENECPACDQLVEETVGFHQSMLLGPRQDMDDIANAVGKIYEHRRKLAAAG